jgi:hypothetical protein
LTDKPLLLVDVYGPANRPAGTFEMVDGIHHYLSASAGAHLRTLSESFELVWCTGWEEKANEYLPRALALPTELPYLSFDRAVGRANTHWKLDAIDAYAGPERPLAWIDDALAPECFQWATHRPGPTLLVETEPAIGITAAHVKQLLNWAKSK